MKTSAAVNPIGPAPTLSLQAQSAIVRSRQRQVLCALAIGPLRPFAPSWSTAGSVSSMQNERERQTLNVLVSRGLAEKAAGGWYRITPAGSATVNEG